MSLALQIFIVIFGVSGFFLARYISRKKKGPQPLVCPIGANCDSVVHSEYSYFFGVPLEFVGMGYYGAIAAGYAAFALIPSFASGEAVFILFAFTTTALLFSFYLTALQAFVLRAWCTWCLSSAGLSVLIFFASLSLISFDLPSLLAANTYFIMLMQLSAVAVGLGSAVISLVFFLKFLRDFRVAEWEGGVLRTLFELQWLSLAGVILSAIALVAGRGSGEGWVYLPDPAVVTTLVATGCLIIIAFSLHYIVMPKLAAVSAGGSHEHALGELSRLRRHVLALALPTATAWLFIFALRALVTTAFGADALAGIFVAVMSASAYTGDALARSLPNV